MSHIFRHTANTASESHILGYLRCGQYRALAHPAVFEEAVFPEPLVLGGSHGAVMRIHWRCVSIPNEQEQSPGNMWDVERCDIDMPQQ